MGVQLKVYVGAYVLIHPPQKKVIDALKECLACGRKRDPCLACFCHQCGASYAATNKEGFKPKNLYELMGINYIRMRSIPAHVDIEGDMIVIGNYRDVGDHVDLDECNGIVQIDLENITSMKEAFMKFYVSDLAILEAIVPDMEIRFGVLTYYN